MLVVQHKTIINFMVLGLICLLVFNLYDGLPSRDQLTLGFNKYHYFVEKPEPEKIVGKTINQEGIPLKFVFPKPSKHKHPPPRHQKRCLLLQLHHLSSRKIRRLRRQHSQQNSSPIQIYLQFTFSQ